LAKNTKPKNRFSGCPKTGFSVLKNLRVTRFFGFGKNRVGNPIVMFSGNERFKQCKDSREVSDTAQV
jgi:hypothetical protein